jgi:hypothetical protein
MHAPIAETGGWLKRVIEGYFNYHAIPGNRHSLGTFRSALARYWRRVLARRSQVTRQQWRRMRRLIRKYFPTARTLFDAMHPR